MVIVFLLLLCIHAAHCQSKITTPNLLYNCSFSNNPYLSSAAVSDQLQLINNTSIRLTASYAFLSSLLSSSTFELGLIYQFPESNYLVPFPISFDCGSIVNSCQLQTMTGTTTTSRISEPIRVQLTPFNYTSPVKNLQFSQMGLYLRQGRYQLSNCSLNNGQQMTDPQTIFNIQIQYEKAVGKSCDSINDVCGSPSLTTCSASTCTCLSSNSRVSYSNVFYCADTLNISNCKIFPSRCVTWCNETTNYLCICPAGTYKVQRNNIFRCELPIDSNNCLIDDDNVRQCSYSQCCVNGKCIDCALTTTAKFLGANDSVEDNLRIALGVVAGLLGTSVIILLGTFCWLRHRQKRKANGKSFSNSSNSSTSSLYISPNQRNETFPTSISTIYQLLNNDEPKTKSFYRTNSFRQAVLSGHREKQIIEHVSTKRDSFTYGKDSSSSPTFSTLEFIAPSMNYYNPSFDYNERNNNNNNNIYQIILPTTSFGTHAV